MTYGKVYDMPSMPCPACGYVIDSATTVLAMKDHDRSPADDDVTVCYACAATGVYADNTTRLRLPTAQERGEIVRHGGAQAMVWTILAMKDHNPLHGGNR